ncbi:MAG: DUF4340 domain-containing protein [Candidatus Riflebacteria bacterium]|nr:DUF4340 domain-containing protein [Candidatus Riflebacteria bacterium]
MKKRFMPTIVAFIILVILVIYANYFETEEILLPGAQKPEQIVDLTQDAVQSITWLASEGKNLKLVFEKDKDPKITEPSSYRADKSEAEGVLRHLSELKSELVVAENSGDLEQFGITASSTKVVISGEKGDVELTIGSKSEVGGSYYLTKKGENKVYLVSGYIKGSFDKKLENLRDKRLFTEAFVDISKISYENGVDKVDLERASSNSTDWKILKPIAYNANNVVVADLIAKIEGLTINRFIEDKANDFEIYELNKPTLRIELTDKNGNKRVLKAGTMSGTETFVTVDDVAVHGVTTLDISALRHNTSEFREKFIPVPSMTDATLVELTDASGTVKLTKSNENWMYNDSKIEKDTVKDLFTGLSRAEVKKYDELRDLSSRKLENKNECKKLRIKSDKEDMVWYLGELQGINMWICNDTECVEISTDVDRAFNRAIDKIRTIEPAH